MSKLTRYTQQVFGSTASAGEIGKFGSFAAGSPANAATPADVQSLSQYLGGWSTAVVGNGSPTIQDVNALNYNDSYQLAYLMQQGIPEWDSGTATNAALGYQTGSIVSYNGALYRSLVNSNTTAPLVTAGNWTPLLGYINVKTFGAKGDGTTIDTTAIQNAVSTGLSVYFPAGTYIIDQTITMSSNNVVYFGDGTGSVIQAAPAVNFTAISGDQFLFYGTNLTSVQARDLTFDSNGPNRLTVLTARLIGYQIINGTDCVVDRCTMMNAMGGAAAYSAITAVNTGGATITVTSAASFASSGYIHVPNVASGTVTRLWRFFYTSKTGNVLNGITAEGSSTFSAALVGRIAGANSGASGIGCSISPANRCRVTNSQALYCGIGLRAADGFYIGSGSQNQLVNITGRWVWDTITVLERSSQSIINGVTGENCSEFFGVSTFSTSDMANVAVSNFACSNGHGVGNFAGSLGVVGSSSSSNLRNVTLSNIAIKNAKAVGGHVTSGSNVITNITTLPSGFTDSSVADGRGQIIQATDAAGVIYFPFATVLTTITDTSGTGVGPWTFTCSENATGTTSAAYVSSSTGIGLTITQGSGNTGRNIGLSLDNVQVIGGTLNQGLSVVACDDLSVTNSVFESIGTTNVQINVGCTNVKLIGNRFRAGGTFNIQVANGCLGVEIYNNEIIAVSGGSYNWGIFFQSSNGSNTGTFNSTGLKWNNNTITGTTTGNVGSPYSVGSGFGTTTAFSDSYDAVETYGTIITPSGTNGLNADLILYPGTWVITAFASYYANSAATYSVLANIATTPTGGGTPGDAQAGFSATGSANGFVIIPNKTVVVPDGTFAHYYFNATVTYTNAPSIGARFSARRVTGLNL